MQYFFIPGRQRELSLAELKSVFAQYKKYEFHVNGKPDEYFTVTTNADTDTVDTAFKRLGGFMRYGEIIDLDSEDWLSSFKDKESIHFGTSYFVYSRRKKSKDATQKVAAINTQLKKHFSKEGIKARFAGSGDRKLNTGSVIQNDLLNKGFELVLLEQKDGTLIAGVTKALQDIEGFAARDFGKPGSDAEMGMLPPKLARIMINLLELEPAKTIWDPFCGSGVLLMEGILLGYNVLGSDISDEAVAMSERNIEWLGQNNNTGDLKFNVFLHDITQEDGRLEKNLKRSEIEGIVFEPYMGPPQRRKMHPEKAQKLINNVTELLTEAFLKFEKIGRRGITVVAVVPSYLTYDGWKSPTYMKFLSKRWEIKNKKDLHWRRSNSIITRNLLIVQLRK